MLSRRNALLSAVVFAAFTAPALSAETVKIAFIDPLSGGAAATGENGLRHYQFIAEYLNGKQNDFKFEVTGYDNKVNPQESLVAAQKAIDGGIRVITQGNGSSVAAALVDFVQKYNDRNPGKEVVYLNYAAVDPILTNEKCSYWHFRYDANSDIKMAALTNFMKTRPNIKKVYLINQDYSFGHSVRQAARAMLKEKRPDVEIVGDEVTPLQKVTDFAPYIAKIKAAGADSVITGNWAQDWNLLVKAAADAGLQADFYTYYAGGAGGPTVVKQTGLQHRVFQISEGIANIEHKESQEVEKAFRPKVGTGVLYPRAFNEMNALLKAMQEAKSADPKKFAPKLEQTKMEAFNGGEAFMRADDHQFFQPMYISSIGPLESGMPFDEENTGWGWKLMGKVDAKDTIVPTTCKMNRPS
ncbi:MAG TPA: branched-chain amino acid ABC transporter substrate-binding protein [Beijerinckiaceae bacterium]|nr:branched-chain amino acid ABC transporter substrate-binding protein [Beijerinckiaceae bacterium]